MLLKLFVYKSLFQHMFAINRLGYKPINGIVESYDEYMLNLLFFLESDNLSQSGYTILYIHQQWVSSHL